MVGEGADRVRGLARRHHRDHAGVRERSSRQLLDDSEARLLRLLGDVGRPLVLHRRRVGYPSALPHDADGHVARERVGVHARLSGDASALLMTVGVPYEHRRGHRLVAFSRSAPRSCSTGSWSACCRPAPRCSRSCCSASRRLSPILQVGVRRVDAALPPVRRAAPAAGPPLLPADPGRRASRPSPGRAVSAFAALLLFHVDLPLRDARRDPFPVARARRGRRRRPVQRVPGRRLDCWSPGSSPASATAYTDTELAWRAPYIGYEELVPFTPWFQGAEWWLNWLGCAESAALGHPGHRCWSSSPSSRSCSRPPARRLGVGPAVLDGQLRALPARGVLPAVEHVPAARAAGAGARSGRHPAIAGVPSASSWCSGSRARWSGCTLAGGSTATTGPRRDPALDAGVTPVFTNRG